MNNSGKAKKPTIKDVAQQAFVSIGTVSRVLNGNGYVGIKTRERILKSIEALGYVPNEIARSMVNRKSSMVGILVPEINNIYFAEMVVAIESVLSKENISVVLCNSKYNASKVTSFVEELIHLNAMGIVMLSTDIFDQALLQRIRENLEAVTVVSAIEEFDSVNLTNWQGGFDMTKHLLERGHTKIACIGFLNEVARTQERLNGYKDALLRHGIEPRSEYIIGHYESENFGSEAARKLFALSDPPTALFSINDYTAINAYNAANECGLVVGKDIAIGGFDDTSYARVVSPPLTTVKYSHKSLAETTARMLLDRVRGEKKGEPIKVTLETELVVRQSTGMSSA